FMTGLTYVPVFLQLILLWEIVRGRFYREFPCFLAYTVFSVFTTAVRFAAKDYLAIYFYVYWSTDFVYSILGVVVLYEVGSKAFKNLGRIQLVRAVFPILLTLTVILTWIRIQIPFTRANPVLAFVVTAEMGVRFLQVLMFIMMLILI